MDLKARPCFLCNKKVYTLKFTNDKLKICRKVLAARKKSNLIFKDIVLPKNSQLNVGYHQKCYNRFQIVQKQHEITSSIIEEEQAPTRKILRSTSTIKDKKLLEIALPNQEINMIARIKQKLDPIGTCQVEFQIPSQSYEDEIGDIKPDISEGSILKAILTRKMPVRKVMMTNFEACI